MGRTRVADQRTIEAEHLPDIAGTAPTSSRVTASGMFTTSTLTCLVISASGAPELGHPSSLSQTRLMRPITRFRHLQVLRFRSSRVGVLRPRRTKWNDRFDQRSLSDGRVHFESAVEK